MWQEPLFVHLGSRQGMEKLHGAPSSTQARLARVANTLHIPTLPD